VGATGKRERERDGYILIKEMKAEVGRINLSTNIAYATTVDFLPHSNQFINCIIFSL
jgi:hypothetical protein